MFLIQKISSDPLQKQALVLEDGSLVNITMYYVPLQFGWFITELTRNDFTLNGLRITNSPNMLNQFCNKIPFGLACYTEGNREPTQQEDFSSGAAKLYILNADEVAEYTEFLRLG